MLVTLKDLQYVRWHIESLKISYVYQTVSVSDYIFDWNSDFNLCKVMEMCYRVQRGLIDKEFAAEPSLGRTWWKGEHWFSLGHTGPQMRLLKLEKRKQTYPLDRPQHPYRVYAEALSVGHGEWIVLVCNDQQVGHRVHSQSVVICPVDRGHVKRERSQMSLR